jgi:LytS/YehU family sensor histidine kinase
MLVWGKYVGIYAAYIPIISVAGLLITLLLRALYRFTWNLHIGWRVLAVLVGSYVAGAAWMACRIATFRQLFPDSVMEEVYVGKEIWAYFEGTTSAFMVMVVWSALYFGIKFYLIAEQEQRRSLVAMSMAHEAQLKMLQYQLNPHFLFNTLNAISTLILDQETQLANTMVTRLSRFLRYTLDNAPTAKVSVAKEMEALRLYLDIEKVRFDDRLHLEIDVQPEAENALMPSLLLQPLVENSIKYAVAQSINGGSVNVSARVVGSELILAVADDGPGLDPEGSGAPRGSGVGLSNCVDRLQEIYGDAQSLQLGRTDPHGLTVTIRIPLELIRR